MSEWHAPIPAYKSRELDVDANHRTPKGVHARWALQSGAAVSLLIRGWQSQCQGCEPVQQAAKATTARSKRTRHISDAVRQSALVCTRLMPRDHGRIAPRHSRRIAHRLACPRGAPAPACSAFSYPSTAPWGARRRRRRRRLGGQRLGQAPPVRPAQPPARSVAAPAHIGGGINVIFLTDPPIFD
eukprot:SAG11_NODE_6021_length_1407_cov_6.364679_2_plen_185_part_00